MSITYKLDDTVWAKMKNYAPWPALVADPKTASVKQPSNKNQVYRWIYFFGTDNFAWIEESNLKPYEEYKDQMLLKYIPNKIGLTKKKSFSDAVNRMENYIREKKKNPSYKPYTDLLKNIEFDNIFYNTPPSTSNNNKRKLSREANSEKKVVQKRIRVELSEDSANRFNKSHNSVSSTVVNNLTDYDVLAPDASANVLDLKTKSNNLISKNVVPIKKRIGFLGVGKMGTAMVKNLKHSGHDVTIWDRNTDKCDQFEKEIGVKLASNPANLVEKTDIVFSCLSDPRASKHAVYMNCGMKESFTAAKAFVELSSMNTEVSLDLSEPILQVGGRYLEAQIQGDIEMAHEGTIIFLTAGDKSLFYEVQSCFKAMGKYSYYLGPNIGEACIMNLAIQTLKAAILAGLAEAMAIIDRFKLKNSDLINTVNHSEMSSEFLRSKYLQISEKKYDNKLTLKYLQKDLRLLFDEADHIKQPLLIAVNTNEVLKQAIRNGYGNMDAAAIYEYIRH